MLAPPMVTGGRTWLPWLAGLVVLGAAVGGYSWWRSEEDRRVQQERAADRERRSTEREERAQENMEALREESADLIPEQLGGLALGMSKEEVRERRPGLRPRLEGGDAALGLTYMEERLPNNAEIVYGFDRADRLAQVQMMSVMPSAEALSAHLTAMIETYGSPTGIWDCPDTGGVPTRRFTWRRAETALADILLIYGNRISQTLYIAPEAIIGASLQRASCRPVRSEEQLANFPTTTVEQLQKTSKQQAPSPSGGR